MNREPETALQQSDGGGAGSLQIPVAPQLFHWTTQQVPHPIGALTLSGPWAITTVAIGAAAVRVITVFFIAVTVFHVQHSRTQLVISLMLPRNASSTCYVTYGRLILAPPQLATKAVRIYCHTVP
jgi:hypothetical protein